MARVGSKMTPCQSQLWITLLHFKTFLQRLKLLIFIPNKLHLNKHFTVSKALLGNYNDFSQLPRVRHLTPVYPTICYTYSPKVCYNIASLRLLEMVFSTNEWLANQMRFICVFRVFCVQTFG